MMERLQELRCRLEKINRARRLNKMLRDKKSDRLQQINTLLEGIIIKNSQNSLYFPKNRIPKIHGLTNDDITYLTKSFWCLEKSSNQINEQHDENTAKIDIQVGLNKFTPEQKRLICIYHNLSTIQQLSVAQRFNPNHTLASITRANFLPINLQLSFHDKIRILIFLLVYGKNVPLEEIFPTLNMNRVSTFINSIKSAEIENIQPETRQRIDHIIAESLSLIRN